MNDGFTEKNKVNRMFINTIREVVLRKAPLYDEYDEDISEHPAEYYRNLRAKRKVGTQEQEPSFTAVPPTKQNDEEAELQDILDQENVGRE